LFIDTVHLQDVPCFQSGPNPSIEGLCKVNFIFGGNGSGKTSAGRQIKLQIETDPQYNNKKTRCLLYNKEYRDRIIATSEIEGKFALGEEAADAEKEIKRLQEQKQKNHKNLERLKEQLGEPQGNSGKYGSLEEIYKNRYNLTWPFRSHLSQTLQQVLLRGLHTKKRFFERVEQAGTSGASPVSLDDLKTSLKSLESSLAGEIQHLQKITIPEADLSFISNVSSLLDQIYVTKPKGQIGRVVAELKNTDWIHEGLEFISHDEANHDCPFCGQSLNAQILEEINNLFDQTYKNQRDALIDAKTAAESATGALEEWWSRIDYPNLKGQLRDTLNDIRAEVSNLTSNLRTMSSELDRKLQSMGTPIASDAVIDISILTGRISDFNELVQENNSIFDSSSTLKESVQHDFFSFVFNETKAPREDSYSSERGVRAAIQKMSDRIKTIENQNSDIEKQLESLRNVGKSSELTRLFINRMLRNIHGDSFSLEPTGNSGRYRVARADGSPANETLSEGESQIVAFLYFIADINNIDDPKGVSDTEAATVIIDDPMSSLDSEWLFVAATLIKQVIARIDDGNSKVDQIFCLSHNEVFYNELCYGRERSSKPGGKTAHYRITKGKFHHHRVKRTENGSVMNGYSALWHDVFAAREKTLSNVSSLGNTMRRILESYFELTNGLNLAEIDFEATEEEEVIFNSLRSWLHSNSHNALDSLFVTVDENEVGSYLKVFEQIFRSSGHGPHFDMMMDRAKPR